MFCNFWIVCVLEQKENKNMQEKAFLLISLNGSKLFHTEKPIVSGNG